MNIKDNIKSILLGAIICIGLIVVPVLSQNGTSTIKSDDLLKLRNLQYEQAKRLIRMQEIKAEFDKLNSENQSISVEISNWIKEQAKIQNVDLAKNTFDFDKLKFVEIKPNE